jgi:hypothetical protein
MLETFSPEKAAALFARLKHNHTWQCPTLTVLRSSAWLDDPTFHIPSDLVVDSRPQMVRTAQALILRCYTTYGRKISHKITSTNSIACDFTTISGGI